MRAIVPAIALLAIAAPALAQSRLPTEGFADLNDRLSPAVVNIATSQRVEGIEDLPRFPPGSPMERLNEGQGEGGGAQITSLGSGFIISPDGVVVTNNHVVESADAIEVILQNGRRHEATVIGRDPATGWAIVAVKNRFQVGDRLEFIQPEGNQTIELAAMTTTDGLPLQIASGVGYTVHLPLPGHASSGLLARFL